MVINEVLKKTHKSELSGFIVLSTTQYHEIKVFIATQQRLTEAQGPIHTKHLRQRRRSEWISWIHNACHEAA